MYQNVLDHIQALTADPKTMFIPDIKDANTIFFQIPPLLPFEKYLDTQLLDNTMHCFLQSLLSATFIKLTSKYRIYKTLDISSRIYKNHYQTTHMAYLSDLFVTDVEIPTRHTGTSLITFITS